MPRDQKPKTYKHRSNSVTNSIKIFKMVHIKINNWMNFLKNKRFKPVALTIGSHRYLSKSMAYTCRAGDPGSIPGSGRSPGEGNGNPL